MTKGVVDSRRKKLIRLMVEVDDVPGMIAAYKAVFTTCKKDTSARVNCYRLLQEPDFVAAIDKLKQEREDALKKARQKEIERIAKEQVVSEIQLDAVVSQIAMGTFKRKKIVTAFNKTAGTFHKAEIEEAPDETAMIAAANILYKRKGSFAPTQIQHEAGDGFIEMLKALSGKKKEQATNV